jgi:hypothetical protein
MRFDLYVKCVLKKVSVIREMIHCFVISPFCQTFRFTCFSKNRDAKQTKVLRWGHLFHMFRCFATQK